MKINKLILIILCTVCGISPLLSMIGEHRKPQQQWVPGEYPADEEIPSQEITTTTEKTKTKPGNIIQTGIKTIKTILTPSSAYDNTTGNYSNYDYSDSSNYGYPSSGLTGGGAGSVSVNTGDINIEKLIRDVNIGITEVTKCENSISSGCASGSSCNVTVGPCSVKTQTQSVNAAPSELSFTRYLNSHKATVVTVQEVMESKTPRVIPLQLTKQNDYTMIIKYKSGGIRDISYMIIALPTEKDRVNAIKDLPLALTSYLKKQDGTIIKIYECPNPEKSSMWSEVSEQKIPVSLTDKVVSQSNIINVEITGLGTLAITYRNMKNSKGQVIPVTRAEYQHFIK